MTCPVCTDPRSQSFANACPLHWLARVVLPSELSAIGLDEMADAREQGRGTMREIEDALDTVEREVNAPYDVQSRAFSLAREPIPHVGPRKAVNAVVSVIRRVRTLRFILDGLGPRSAPIPEPEIGDYVSPNYRRNA